MQVPNFFFGILNFGTKHGLELQELFMDMTSQGCGGCGRGRHGWGGMTGGPYGCSSGAWPLRGCLAGSIRALLLIIIVAALLTQVQLIRQGNFDLGKWKWNKIEENLKKREGNSLDGDNLHTPLLCLGATARLQLECRRQSKEAMC